MQLRHEIDLTGTWVGEYRYGPVYGEDLDAVPFRLSCTQHGSRLLGYVRDEVAAGGFPERGRIQGSIQGLGLSFRKVMPVTYVFDEEGASVRLEDFLRDQWSAELDAEAEQIEIRTSPHVITYEGAVEPGSFEVKGIWQIPPMRISVDGQSLEAPRGMGDGRFTMRRVDPNPSAL